jgi:FtsZ-binding cell division protein ZapB
MIVCISPSSVHYDETHNTLKYGNRAKEIKTKVSRNTLNFDRHVSQYVKLIYELRQEIAELKEKSKSHSNEVEEGFKKQLERYRKLTEEAISQVQSGQERARANIEEMGNLRALITCIENAKKLVEGWLRRYQGLVGDIAVGAMNLPEVFKSEAERKKVDAEELLKCLSERHRNYISRLMFLQGGEGNIFEQSCKSALRMLTNNGVDEFHMEYVKAEIRACKATMERDAAIRQGLKMEEDTTHYVTSLSSWIDTNFNSVNELAHNADWTSEGEQELSASVQTLWDFTAKLFRFKAAKYLGQQESPNRPFLSTASTILTPSRKARFLAQFEGSPVMPSPRRSPRKFKVGTPKRNATQVKRKSPRKEKKKVRWTEAPPQEFQLPQDQTPIPSPTVFPVLQPSTEDDSFTETKPEQPEQPSRPILPLPLRKRKSTQQFGGGILKQGVPPFVTEFGSLQQDDSFLSNTSSQNSPLKEISPPGQLRSKPSRTDLSAVDPGSLRGTKRPGTITASPGRAKRVFSASSVPNNNKENGLPSVRRASDSPVKHGPGGCVTRRMTLGGSAGRVTNPGWGSMGPPAAAALSAVKTASSSDQGSLRGSTGKRGWR